MLLPAFRFLMALFLAMLTLSGAPIAIVSRSGLVVATRSVVSLDLAYLSASIAFAGLLPFAVVPNGFPLVALLLGSDTPIRVISSVL